MSAVAVVSSAGIPLMPTSSYRARKLLKSGRAEVFRHRPLFTIWLKDRKEGNTQPVEYKCDTGYQHIGISVCSGKHEYVNAQYDMLPDETEKHNDRRKYRRTRRNRLRYRKARWQNRKDLITREGFAPSIRNKRDIHIRLFEEYAKVIPIRTAVFEMGQFDTQVLKAVQEGRPLPEGTDYQHGERYGIETLREAVFTRDSYRCIVCNKTGGILHVHHVGFWKNDRTDRLSNLASVCDKCHTSKNHKKDGKLYGLEPKLKGLAGATFMTMVRWDMLKRIRRICQGIALTITYGAATKLSRKDLHLPKTHSNDAYSMGEFQPKHRTDHTRYQKRRRNNRVLEKFYDAKYEDIRDGSKKSGSQLSCNRTNRRESRRTEKNERIFHGAKLSLGRRSVRTSRNPLPPGTIVLYHGEKLEVHGIHRICSKNPSVEFKTKASNGKKSSGIKQLSLVRYPGGWIKNKERSAFLPRPTTSDGVPCA